MDQSQNFTLQELYEFYQENKSYVNYSLTSQQISDIFISKKQIANTEFEIVNNAFKNVKIRMERNKSDLKRFKKFNNSIGSNIILTVKSNVQDSDNLLSETDYRKSLKDVGPRQKYRRTKSIIQYLNEEALKNQVTLNVLLGIIISQVNYKQDRKVYDIGKKIHYNEHETFKLSFEAATYLQQSMNLSRNSYRLLRVSLPNGNEILPGVERVKAHYSHLRNACISHKFSH